MQLANTFRCPRCKSGTLDIQSDCVDDELLPARGAAICDDCRASFPISNSILDLSGGTKPTLTLAGWSNHLPAVPQIYENVWRPHALTLLTGQPFPPAREMALLNEWAQVQPDDLVVDLGTSTGNYARGLARATRDWGKRAPTIIAIDLARGMLSAAHSYAVREGIRNIAHVLAPVEQLPFKDGSLNVLVSGGSLNEFHSMKDALCEAYRVCAPAGRLVTMSLLAGSTLAGRLAQASARLSGITFPSLPAFNGMSRAVGWECAAQQVSGVVAFSLFVKTSNHK